RIRFECRGHHAASGEGRDAALADVARCAYELDPGGTRHVGRVVARRVVSHDDPRGLTERGAQGVDRRSEAVAFLVRSYDHERVHRAGYGGSRQPPTSLRRDQRVPDIEAHITGTVWKIECQVGDQISEGDTVAILESMKMEMPVEAEDEGVVKEILCEEG